jgi:hypothetical protein
MPAGQVKVIPVIEFGRRTESILVMAGLAVGGESPRVDILVAKNAFLFQSEKCMLPWMGRERYLPEFIF